MKNYKLIIYLLIILFTTACDEDQDDIFSSQEQYRISEIITERESVSYLYKHKYLYDEQGRLTQIVDFIEDEEQECKENFKSSYEYCGDTVKVVLESPRQDGWQEVQKKYYVITDNLLRKVITYSWDENISTDWFGYDTIEYYYENNLLISWSQTQKWPMWVQSEWKKGEVINEHNGNYDYITYVLRNGQEWSLREKYSFYAANKNGRIDSILIYRAVSSDTFVKEGKKEFGYSGDNVILINNYLYHDDKYGYGATFDIKYSYDNNFVTSRTRDQNYRKETYIYETGKGNADLFNDPVNRLFKVPLIK